MSVSYLLKYSLLLLGFFSSTQAWASPNLQLNADLEKVASAIVLESQAAYKLECQLIKKTQTCFRMDDRTEALRIKTSRQGERLSRLRFYSKGSFAQLDSWNRIENYRGDLLARKVIKMAIEMGYACGTRTTDRICGNVFESCLIVHRQSCMQGDRKFKSVVSVYNGTLGTIEFRKLK